MRVPLDQDELPGGGHRPRKPMAAGRVLVAGLIALLLWALLDARTLQRSAQGAPLGARRTVALAILDPLVSISRVLGLDSVGSTAERALGRDPNGAPGGGPPAPLITTPPPTPTPSGSPTGPAATPTPSPSPTTAKLPRLRKPTETDPLRVLVVGDSLAEDLGIGLSRALDPRRFDLILKGLRSTGLARPDYYDWPAAITAEVSAYRPDLVVAMFGGNDFNQGLVLPNGRTVYPKDARTWNREYARRVRLVISNATSLGARLAWVGLPVMGDPARSASARNLNAIDAREIDHRPATLYVDSYRLFLDANGRYTAYLPDTRGNLQLIREPDQVHLTPVGDDILATAVVGRLRKAWGLVG
jgi:hypothetical protein